MLLLALFLFGTGCWFVYDGMIAWPQNNEKAAIYLPMKDLHGEDRLALEKQWLAEAAARGWPKKAPKKMYSASDIQTQYICAAVAFAITLGCLGFFVWSLPRKLLYEAPKLTLTNKQVLDIHSIKHINKKRWKSQSIAVVRYDAGGGIQKTFKLDDYKYIGTAEILDAIQEELTPKQAT